VLRKSCLLFLFLILLVCINSLYAGITGTLSGTIIDKKTEKALPGAQIVIKGTTMGAMADKNGFYMIQNLPAGTYDLSVHMIGYSIFTIKDVQINLDLNTTQNFYLPEEVLTLKEVIITKKRQLIQSEITSSTYFISGEEIDDRLPIDSYLDAITLLPGVVGNHFRGGRRTDVLYMLDGLPIQSGLSREISSNFPNSSVVEIMVQTGGFNAEYGNATSGIVNVVTKDGRNRVEGMLKIFSDFIDTGFTGNDNTRRMEFNVGGPMTIGLGGPLINAKYFISADLNISDTRHRKEMRQAFDSPIFTNYNINSKLSFDINRNTILSFQGLLSNLNWRKFDPQWEQNLSGLAQHKHLSHRLSVSLTHTFNPKFFASVRIANYSNNKRISSLIEDELESPTIEFEDPADASSPIISGKQPWREETKEKVKMVKVDLVGQISSSHLLKAGLDFQKYDLTSEGINFIPLPTRGENTSITFNKNINNFHYSPTFFALYIQDKFEYKGVIVNAGLRYDVFSPQAAIKELPDDFKNLQKTLQGQLPSIKSGSHSPVSPRLGISIPLSASERLHINYGWYYQMPPLFYLYSNAAHNLNGYVPFVGNFDLEPTKTISTEFSYKRSVSDGLLFVFTGFIKQFRNLIDTQTLVFSDSLIDNETTTAGFTNYTNSASGKTSGFEVMLQKRFTDQLAGRMSYTYMKARGNSSSAEEEFNRVIFGGPVNDGSKEFPLSWDQRHSIILNADYESSRLQFNLLYSLFSPLPATTQNSETPNDTRLSWRNILDLKLKLKTTKMLGSRLNPFFEIRNLFNTNNMVDTPSNNGAKAYNLFNPIQSDFGRRFRVGLSMEF